MANLTISRDGGQANPTFHLAQWKSRISATAYFLTQINQDSFNGYYSYYQTQMGIANTKEQALGYGPGLAYFTKEDAFLEIKTFFETAAINRVVGYRSTLRVAVPIY